MSALGEATLRLLVYIAYWVVPPLRESAPAVDRSIHLSANMSAVYDPLIPSSHLQAVEDKLRLHAASMLAPPSPPVSASDFINDNDSASTTSPPSSPSTPTSSTTSIAASPTLVADRPDQLDAPSPPPPVCLTTLLSPTAKKLSTLITPPSPATRRISDEQSSDEEQAARAVGQSLHAASTGSHSLHPPAVGSPLLLHSLVGSSPSPEPLPLPDDLIEDAATTTSPSPSSSPSPNPTSASSQFTAKSAYPEDSDESRQLKLIYKVFHTVCDLFFNVDKDLHNLTDKRQRNSTKQLETGVQALHSNSHNHRRSIPATVSPGYGELARRGFDKVLYYLCHEAPDILRMGEDCSFLDIGSGFGKCVLHAKVRGKVRESVGIEYIPVRHEKAAETLHLLRARFVPGVTDVYEQGSQQHHHLQQLLESIDLSGVHLVQGDITDHKHHALLFRASHIYMFDVVFSDHTMAKILPAIEQANFALFACYHRPAYLERLGCTQFVCIHKMAMKTTGKQSFTCYFYVKAAAGAKITRHTQRQWAEAAKEGRSTGDAADDDEAGEEEANGAAATKKRKRKAKSSLFTVAKRSKAHIQTQSRDKRKAEQQQDESEEQQSEAEEEEEEEYKNEDEEEEQEEVEKVEKVSKQRKRKRDREPSKRKRSARVEKLEILLVPVAPKKKREVTTGTAEVLARDVFNACVIKAVAARLVIEAEREARLQRRYALGVMQLLLSEQRGDDEAASESQPASDVTEITSAPVADQHDVSPPPFQRTSTLITDVHSVSGVQVDGSTSKQPNNQPLPADQPLSPPAASQHPPSLSVYPLSSLALLPMSPTNRKAAAAVYIQSMGDSITQSSPSKVSPISAPSSSLSALTKPSPTTTPASGGTVTALSWPATSTDFTADVAAPSSAAADVSTLRATTTVTQPLSTSPTDLSPSSSAPNPPPRSDRYVCPYCTNCVDCVSECFGLPRHQLTKKQIVAYGAQHAMPPLLRALPFIVQTCIEAWDEEKPTDPRQLLRRMEYSTARDEGKRCTSGNSSSDASRARPKPEPLPATVADSSSTGNPHHVAEPSATAATTSEKRHRQPSSAIRKKVGAWSRPTGKTKNSKYVYAADRKLAKAQQVEEQKTGTGAEQMHPTQQQVAQLVETTSEQTVEMKVEPVVTDPAAVATLATEMDVDSVEQSPVQ